MLLIEAKKSRRTLHSIEGTFYSIQALRGVAAMLVVFFHSTQFFNAYFQATPFRNFFSFGFCGVHIFFVLSGFIIFTIHFLDINKPQKFFIYLKKRAVRLYPIYWITLILAILLTDKTVTLYDFYKNFLLLNMPIEFINPVCWTLSFEVLFYILFSFLILNRTLGTLLISVWMFGVFGSIFFDIKTPFIFRQILHNYTVLFMMGCLSAYLVIKLKKLKSTAKEKIAYTMCFLGCVLFSLMVFYVLDNKITNWDTWKITLGFGLSSAMLMFSVLSKKMNEFFGRQRIVIALGNASYSIYLIHYLFLKNVLFYAKMHITLNENIINILLFATVCILATFVGYFIYWSIERPLLKYMRTLLL